MDKKVRSPLMVNWKGQTIAFLEQKDTHAQNGKDLSPPSTMVSPAIGARQVTGQKNVLSFLVCLVLLGINGGLIGLVVFAEWSPHSLSGWDYSSRCSARLTLLCGGAWRAAAKAVMSKRKRRSEVSPPLVRTRGTMV